MYEDVEDKSCGENKGWKQGDNGNGIKLGKEQSKKEIERSCGKRCEEMLSEGSGCIRQRQVKSSQES